MQRNFTITADFVPITYAITVTQTPNGYVTPYTYSGFTAGATQAYSIRPNAGCRVLDVSVDGASVGAVTSYTFTNIRTNHTIAAAFGPNPAYSITASAGPNGSISPPGVTSVIGGLNQTYTVKPAAGFRVAAVIVDGVNKGALGSYTFYTVGAPHTIDATFVVDTYTINAGIAGGAARRHAPGDHDGGRGRNAGVCDRCSPGIPDQLRRGEWCVRGRRDELHVLERPSELHDHG